MHITLYLHDFANCLSHIVIHILNYLLVEFLILKFWEIFNVRLLSRQCQHIVLLE